VARSLDLAGIGARRHPVHLAKAGKKDASARAVSFSPPPRWTEHNICIHGPGPGPSPDIVQFLSWERRILHYVGRGEDGAMIISRVQAEPGPPTHAC